MPMQGAAHHNWLGQVSNKCPFGLGEQTLGKMAVGKSTVRQTIVGELSVIQKIIRRILMVSKSNTLVKQTKISADT